MNLFSYYFFSTHNPIMKGIKEMYFYSKPKLVKISRKHSEFALVILANSLYRYSELQI